jgi:hypothetical protein
MDLELLLGHVRDLNQRQTELFFLINTFLMRYEPPELQPLFDADIADAAAALAGTFETAVRGVIYEHRAASLPADRLVTALKPVITEAGARAGSGFERDAAFVMRRIESAVRATAGDPASPRRAYVELLRRVMKEGGEQASGASGASNTAGGETPRLIIE